MKRGNLIRELESDCAARDDTGLEVDLLTRARRLRARLEMEFCIDSSSPKELSELYIEDEKDLT